MSIKDFSEKINSNPRIRPFLLAGIVILASTGSFGLGRLSGAKTGQTPIIIEKAIGTLAVPRVEIGKESHIPTRPTAKTPLQTAAISQAPSTVQSGAFYASKNGTKYYPIGCKAGNRILEKNRIFFKTANEAELLGLGRASGCK